MVQETSAMWSNGSANATLTDIQNITSILSDILMLAAEEYPQPEQPSAAEAGEEIRGVISQMVAALRGQLDPNANFVRVSSTAINMTAQATATRQLTYDTSGAGNATILLPENVALPVTVAMWTCSQDVHGGALNASDSLASPSVSFSIFGSDGELTSFEGEQLLIALPVAAGGDAERSCVGQPSERDVFEKMRSGASLCQTALQCKFWDTQAKEWSEEGCETVALNGTTDSVGCRCTHLTDFISIKVPVLCPCPSTPSPLPSLHPTPLSFPTSPRSPT
jgi:hypothetical protein